LMKYKLRILFEGSQEDIKNIISFMFNQKNSSQLCFGVKKRGRG